MSRPFIDRCLAANRVLPVLEFAQLPTAVEPLGVLGKAIGCERLYVKRDDLTGTAYGGNKVRKLEFLLGQARARGAKSVLTFGAAGSNHCLATAVYAKQAGLRCTAMLVPQHNAHSVRGNLLAGFASGSRLELHAGRPGVALGTAAYFAEEFVSSGTFPSVFPPGGSSPVGCLGYVNAALELAEQVAAGVCPEPDVIYVASGTMGTCVGLTLGLCLTRLKTKVMAIAVTSPPYTSEAKSRKLFEAANHLLCEVLPEVPMFAFPEDRLTLRTEFLGKEYALYTDAGMEAVRLAKELGNLRLEGTYTGKTMAALISDARAGGLSDRMVLFWNTYNSADLSPVVAGMDYRQLPAPLHRFFEEPVQPLDR